MTFKEIIDELNHIFCGLYVSCSREELDRKHEAIHRAIDLLRTHQDNQPNEPLTLEELREMDGQPVWCQPDEDVGYWVLVTGRASKVVVRDQYGMTADVEVWMKRGERYYRRPPKEEA